MCAPALTTTRTTIFSTCRASEGGITDGKKSACDAASGWRRAGNSKATIRTETQAEAIAVAREIARNQEAELFIHGVDGRIRERDSYGNDPYPPEG